MNEKEKDEFEKQMLKILNCFEAVGEDDLEMDENRLTSILKNYKAQILKEFLNELDDFICKGKDVTNKKGKRWVYSAQTDKWIIEKRKQLSNREKPPCSNCGKILSLNTITYDKLTGKETKRICYQCDVEVKQ